VNVTSHGEFKPMLVEGFADLVIVKTGGTGVATGVSAKAALNHIAPQFVDMLAA
jgi:hypothetical protein